MMLECPRCNRTLIAHNGEPDAECNCHLYCQDGEKPQDCSVTWPYEWSGSYKWPTGLEVGADDYSDHQHRAMGYCATHENYYYKDKVVIDLDWEQYFSRRAPKHLRMSLGQY